MKSLYASVNFFQQTCSYFRIKYWNILMIIPNYKLLRCKPLRNRAGIIWPLPSALARWPTLPALTLYLQNHFDMLNRTSYYTIFRRKMQKAYWNNQFKFNSICINSFWSLLFQTVACTPLIRKATAAWAPMDEIRAHVQTCFDAIITKLFFKFIRSFSDRTY